MRLISSILLLIVLASGSARAGAWPRAEGEAFVAASVTLRHAGGGQAMTWDSSLLAEYGLRPRLTVGVDLNDDFAGQGHALGFARILMGPTDARVKLAAGFGLGGQRRSGEWLGMGRATIALGYGFDTGAGPAWVALDATTDWRAGDPDPVFKIDATFGLSVTDRVKTMLAVETYRTGTSTGWALIPTLGLRIARGRTLTAGIEVKQTAMRSYGLKLGLWQEF